jgi:hypothetical protein
MTLVMAHGIDENRNLQTPGRKLKSLVKIRLWGNTRALLDVRYTMETARPLRIIDTRLIRSTGTQRNHETGKTIHCGRFNENFDVHGYMGPNAPDRCGLKERP